jgi:protein PhnA
MTVAQLMNRASQCELCSSTNNLSAFDLISKSKKGADAEVLVCEKCSTAINKNDYSDTHHWRSLQDAIWNENAPVKVLSYRILQNLRSEAWALDLIDQIYLEDEDLKWAKEGVVEISSSGPSKICTDSNGTPLLEGDSVTLIKDLDVKGAGFTAKRGTLVKNIKLTENPEHIEGRVNGIGIVLVAKFMKKVQE